MVIGPKGSDVSSANFIEVTFAGAHTCGETSQSNHAHSSIFAAEKNAYVHTQQCTMKDTVGDAPLWSADHALFFSNDAVALAGDWDGTPTVAEPLPESFYDFFLQPADPWFIAVQEVCAATTTLHGSHDTVYRLSPGRFEFELEAVNMHSFQSTVYSTSDLRPGSKS